MLPPNLFRGILLMNRRITINEKKLTKPQVQELLKNGGAVYDKQVSHIINMDIGFNALDIYKLADGNYLYVSAVQAPGKGDIWPKAYVEKEVARLQRQQKKPILKDMSNVEHWYYFSKVKKRFPTQVSPLISSLFSELALSKRHMDYSYDSLDRLSKRLNELGGEVVERELYDGIVAYLGEMLIRKVDGTWSFDEDKNLGLPIRPKIVTSYPWVWFDPITPVFLSFSEPEFTLRRNLANEIFSKMGRNANSGKQL